MPGMMNLILTVRSRKPGTRLGGFMRIVKWQKALKTVCGYNYLANFADWLPGFERLVLN